jgi:hypothetical protein
MDIYKLSATPPPDWIESFRNPQFAYNSYFFKGPQNFNIAGNKVEIQIDGGETVEQMTEYAKQFVDLANKRYALNRAAEHERSIESRRVAQQKAIQQAEERIKMLERIAELKF